MRMIAVLSLLALAPGLAPRSASAADEPALKAFEQTYPLEIRPLLQRFCHECHSAKLMEAEIDLSEFAALADLRKDPQTWQKVGEMLDSAQMPPRKAKLSRTPEEHALDCKNGKQAAISRSRPGSTTATPGGWSFAASATPSIPIRFAT